MKKYLLIALCFATVLVARAQKVLVNDPNAVLRSVNQSFHSIKVSGGIDLYLSQHDDETIAVSAKSTEDIDNIKTEISGGQLNIYYDGSRGWSTGNKKMKVYVSFKKLDYLKASGASDVQVAGSIQGELLQIELSGASALKTGVQVQKLDINLSGASDVKLSGTATNFKIESSGASDVKAFDLVVETCYAKASGASDININVTKSLEAHASGASDIHYKGGANITNIQSSGASSVGRRD
ncbi:MAG: hypothetical protein RLY16_550 [Bacteroidota bacterium]